MKRIAVFGMGYVGCVTAACLSRDGHHVIGTDVDECKVDTVNRGHSPVSEPGLAELMRQQLACGRLRATTDSEHAVRNSEMALIAVGTPSATDGSVQSRAVEKVVEQICRILQQTEQDYTIVIRSTLLPGILEERLLPLVEPLAGANSNTQVQLCNHPEFLRETTAIRDYDNPPFIVVGADDQSVADQVFGLYPNIHAERIYTDTRTAAMVKYTCNAFHALKVGFANEIGALSNALGANGQEVMRIACRDTRLNISPAYLRPGFAFGGSCLPKDVRALRRFAQQQALQVDLINSILPSNNAHIARAVDAVMESGVRRIGLVGLSFKAGTDDLRESPQVILAETLLGRGFDLRIYDPGVRVPGLIGSNLAYVDVHLPHLAKLLVTTPEELYQHAELLVLGTDIANELSNLPAFTGSIFDLRCDLVSGKRTETTV